MHNPISKTRSGLLASFFLASALLTFCNSISAQLSDAKLIEGTWLPVNAELGGHAMPDAVLKTITLKLTAGKYAVSAAGAPDNGTYSLDPSTKPKSMTVTGAEGPNKGKIFPAIYEVETDTLRICYDLSGQKRPSEFKTLAGTRLYLVTYHRKKE